MNVLPFFYFQILMILRAKSTLDAVIRPHYNLIASLFYQFLLVELRAGVVALKTNMALGMPVPGQNDMLKIGDKLHYRSSFYGSYMLVDEIEN